MQRAFVLGTTWLFLLGAAGCRRQANESPRREEPRAEPAEEDLVEEASPGLGASHAHRELPFGTKLVPSTSELDLEPGLPFVVIGPEAVTLDGKAVIALTEGAFPSTELYGGKGGYTVKRLLEAMKRRGDEIAKGSKLPLHEQWYEKISIAPDERTTSDVLHKVLDSARGGGFLQYQLVVSNSAGHHRALRTCSTRCCRQPSPPCWGVPQPPPVDILFGGEVAGDLDEVMRSVKGPGKARVKASIKTGSDSPANTPSAPEPEVELDNPLNLMVAISGNGIRLFTTSIPLPEGCAERRAPNGVTLPRGRDGSYDFESLGRCFVRIHSEHSDESEIVILTNSSVDWATIVRVIDLARGDGARQMFHKFSIAPLG